MGSWEALGEGSGDNGGEFEVFQGLKGCQELTDTNLRPSRSQLLP